MDASPPSGEDRTPSLKRFGGALLGLLQNHLELLGIELQEERGYAFRLFLFASLCLLFGLLLLIGLSAALVVVFWDSHRLAAILEACRLRLRPILMTSFAFIMGVVPLVLSSGAGAEMRHAMGVAVFSGMLGVTFFGLLLTPVFYLVIRAFVEKREARKAVFKEARA